MYRLGKENEAATLSSSMKRSMLDWLSAPATWLRTDTSGSLVKGATS
jgi:hypothetical protein